jgi:hypothetical protein
MKTFIPILLAFTVSSSAVFAQDTVEMKDENAKFTMQLGGDMEWQVSTDLTGAQSSVVAMSLAEDEPTVLVTLTTYLEVNSLALMGGSIAQKTVDGFLDGVCSNFECEDISNRSYEEIAGRKFWIASTLLNFQGYKDMGISDSIMIATSSPEGYMQLFSLHTAQGRAEDFKPLLIEAIKTIQPLTP